jgi:hypothetical protein
MTSPFPSEKRANTPVIAFTPLLPSAWLNGWMMTAKRSAGLLLMLSLTASAAVSASDIYTWTDANGIVHFGDRPGGTGSEKIITIDSQRTDPAEVQARLKPRAGARPAPAEDGAAAPTEPVTAEDLRAAERERAEKCTMYRERLQKFLTSRRLYRQDENGERVYLDEEESAAARAKVQEQVVEFCGP